MIKHTIRISKDADQRLQEGPNQRSLDTLLAGVNTAFRTSKGWKVLYARRVGVPWVQHEGTEKKYAYYVDLEVTCDKNRPDSEFQDIVRSLDNRGKSQPGPGSKWRVIQVESRKYEAKKQYGEQKSDQEVTYHDLSIPPNWKSFFTPLYGLESHVNIVHQSIRAAIKSDWRNRFHGVFIGDPGCGKSHLCSCIKDALGEDSVLEFDATSTTAAGAIRELTERDRLPRIMVVEEIEKALQETLSWMLSVLDLRGNITKTTFRARIQSDARMLCFATVNNKALFESLNSGALASRFSNKLHFARPSWEMIARILAREIDEVGGKHTWIEPTIEYARIRNITDPRQLIAIALCGEDQLLTGRYQKQLDETSEVVD